MTAISRRTLLRGAGTLAAAGAMGVTATGIAEAVPGLDVVQTGRVDHRLEWFRFSTPALQWGGGPMVNVLLPDGYHTSGAKRYPVLYLMHGGLQDFRVFHQEYGVYNSTAWKDLIVVMPDGGKVGWHSNAVSAPTGPKNWETFHVNQLIPWVDETFRTFGEYDGRAIAGFSMGGFGALKYAAKYYGHFCAVTSFSGPASIRRDGGLVANYMNATSALETGSPAGIYGAPWREDLVTADNPVQRIPSFGNKRIKLFAGTNPQPGFDWLNEAQVLAGHREFRSLLFQAGIPHEFLEHGGGHGGNVGYDLATEIPQIIGRLRRAG